MESGIVFYNKDFFEVSDTQDDLIKENCVRILKTRPGERVNNLSFGSNIHNMLFMSDMLVSDVVYEIRRSIEANEPRAEVLNVELLKNLNEEIEISLSIRSRISGSISDVNLVV